MAPLYYCIQYTTYFPIYMVDFPVTTEMYLTEFRDLITLEDLKLNKLLEHIFKDFDLEKMLGIEG